MARILLVEDNELNRDMLVRRLTRKGYDTAAAVDGKSAMAALTANKPDLILMDLRLPDISGLDLTRKLKADAETKHIPIIALTAYAMSGDRASALAAGADEYDTKPVDLPRLLAKMEALLKGNPSS